VAAPKVLLLGSTGFVGRAVAHKLLDTGYQLRVLVRDQLKAAAYKMRGAEVIVGDVLDPNALGQACEGVDGVVDLVAVRRNHPQAWTTVNIDAAGMVAQAAKTHNVKSMVFVSVVGAELKPQYKYLTSRWLGEDAVHKSGMPAIILRFSLIIGEDGGVLDDFRRAANFGPVIVIPGNGQTKFQPILRDDVARCIIEAMPRADLLGKTLDLGGPEVLSYDELFEMFCEAQGITKRRVHVPAALLVPGAALLDLLSPEGAIATPDEIRTIQKDNLGAGLDVVASYFSFKATSPRSWIPEHWKPRPG
jgi:NADH dehydrogenase